jgi:hypothetical protein
MKQVKKTPDHQIYQKRSGRYAVKDRTKRWIHGDDKVKVLLEAGLISMTAKKPAEPEAEAQTPVEETADAASV